ncbi:MULTISPECIES: response regulator [Chryseobacterium]|uniref:Response regulator uvrY n=1 Tax=Chryseobacterium balustinum TaxID=246 RepID=A0AAX2IK87_9FLAO|nr:MULTISPECIES: response regulator transcription factor [Chryseobacterium]AZB28055.1 DNA-binding response regulator [Chryseobacterium balustinum]MDY0932618.1 response regulator transcription factor [Chryseobacterium sp. CFBP8996]OBW41783.1 Response regulator UvrY [Chryseobacterium sp. MOF25P]OBW47080.1 Response regulator UvrY [Chryseobacterium sp. BGARF1]SKB56023.1 two component transcriptional regulator, LuxR family [Chryseobacterium balustinum]
MNNLKTKTINFLLADDHSLIRQGVEFLIEEIGFEGEIFHASTLQKVLEAVGMRQIEIVVIDAIFPDGNSLNIISDIRSLKPDIKILVFSGVDESTQSIKYINAGANGFLSKLSEESEIKEAILKIHQTGKYISSITQDILIDSLQNRSSINPLQKLTERELEIAELYAKGYGNLEIANNLNVKQNTISTIKKRIFDKLHIENVVDLADLIKNYH